MTEREFGWVALAVVSAFLVLFFIALYVDLRRPRTIPPDDDGPFLPDMPLNVLPLRPCLEEDIEPWHGKATYYPLNGPKPKEAA